LPTLVERIYAAITIYVADVRLSAEIAVGSFLSPLLRSGLIAGLILSVPWWAHRRRRAKVRMKRKLQAWCWTWTRTRALLRGPVGR
jgi:hypothetical protein